ncbi:hypothetical protein AMTR_s00002p00203730 [Amborella trichopoda]|uniref:Uncharacterized protein n=1 Tax=Amborella trichopoda TaxID=13333 RepID=W1NU28_AMBTC|nr:hypothetical protein AMTR_s00002p00203730 [Amborella trichopoda]
MVLQAWKRGFQPLLPFPVSKPDFLASHLLLKSLEFEVPWKSSQLFPNVQLDLSSMRSSPVLVDSQGAEICHPESLLLSSRIVQQCMRYERSMQFLGDNGLREDLDSSLLTDLSGLYNLALNMNQNPPFTSDYGFSHYYIGDGNISPSVIDPRRASENQEKLHSGFYQDFHNNPVGLTDPRRALESQEKVHSGFYHDFHHNPVGQALLTPREAELKELCSIISELYLTKNSTYWSKQVALVPHFIRDSDSRVAPAWNQHAAMMAPVKSPDVRKQKASPRKRRKNMKLTVRERELYGKSLFHACENLISLILNKRSGQTGLLALVHMGPEVGRLLSGLAVGLAGTGLAVMLCILSKGVRGRTLSKLVNTGIGFGLVWVSWAINGLRDAIISMGKSSNKLRMKEQQTVVKLQRGVDEILFRAATVMAVAMLGFV